MKDNKRLIDRWEAAVKKLKEDTFSLYLAYRHPDTPWYAKMVAGIVTAYAFSPIDLIPDFIPVVGYLDDLVLVPLGIALAVRLVPEAVMQACREEARAQLAVGKPVNRAAAVVIVILWISVAYLAVRGVLGLIRK